MTGETFTVGKSADCDLRVTGDEYVSAHHCLLTRHPNGPVTVADLGSSNGTWIVRGGVRFRVTVPQPVYPGDVLVVGRTSIPLPWREPIRVQAEVDKR